MHGAIIACTVHNQVHNAHKGEWQEVTPEEMAELLEMAHEMGDVTVWQGCCSQCSTIVTDSYKKLYESRYATAYFAEFGSEIMFPTGDASES